MNDDKDKELKESGGEGEGAKKVNQTDKEERVEQAEQRLELSEDAADANPVGRSRRRVVVLLVVMLLLVVAVIVSLVLTLGDKESVGEKWKRLSDECFDCVEEEEAFCREMGCYYGDCRADCYVGGRTMKDWRENCETDSVDHKRCVDEGICDACAEESNAPPSTECKEDCREFCFEYDYSGRASYICSTGRPFRQDLEGSPILADILTFQDHQASPWSEPLPLNFLPPSSSQQTATTKTLQQEQKDKIIQWSQRAVGEHASIASFSSFVISLMVHGAPPLLISQALAAAADELRHARLAFSQAAVLASLEAQADDGSNVEATNPHAVGVGPAALPQTELNFSYNMTTLGMSVAQEGCIEETFSALALAVEATTVTNSQERKLLMSIASDEARHAGLAWRTVEWVCQSNAAACRAVQSRILNLDRIKRILETHGKGWVGTGGGKEGVYPDVLRLFDFLMQWLTNPETHHICLAHEADLRMDSSTCENRESNLLDCIKLAIKQDVCRDYLSPRPNQGSPVRVE